MIKEKGNKPTSWGRISFAVQLRPTLASSLLCLSLTCRATAKPSPRPRARANKRDPQVSQSHSLVSHLQSSNLWGRYTSIVFLLS